MIENPNTTSFDFESLELYKKSLAYVDFVYNITTEFPKDEMYGLISQFRRAANSISLNIGEGYGESIPLALRYLRISRGSIRECLVCSTIASRRNYIDKKVYLNSRNKLAEISAGYRKYLILKK